MKKIKKMKHSFVLFIVLLLLAGIGIAVYLFFQGKVEDTLPEEVTTIETKILEIYLSDTNHTASLTVSKEGGMDQIRLQEDTVIKDVNGNKLTFSDLEIGQKIRATTHTDVLYDSLVVEEGSDISDSSVNIFVRCYEVTILE